MRHQTLLLASCIALSLSACGPRGDNGDADTTDLENIMRLKMPFLLRKAVNMEYFTQLFK